MNYDFNSKNFTTADVIKGIAVLRLIGTRGGLTCYTVGAGGESFQSLKAARTYARRLSKA